MECIRMIFPKLFLSTPSARRATCYAQDDRRSLQDFYPRPPRGGRPYCAEWYGWRRVNFYPRPPRGGRPTSTDIHPAFRVFLSTPSARRATGPESVDGQNCGISIHALREEGDQADRPEITTHCAISIHALREEGDRKNHDCHCSYQDFYPRPPRGGRLMHRESST